MNIVQVIRRWRINKTNVILETPVTNLGKITLRISGTGKLRIGKRFSCRDNVLFNISQGILTLGDEVFLNDGVKINCRKNITIGDRVIVGQNVTFYDHDHDWHEIDSMRTTFKDEDIYIGNDVWIGANVVILRGAVIGNGCVVGAGTVVKGIIPSNTMVYQERNLITKRIRGEEN